MIVSGGRFFGNNSVLGTRCVFEKNDGHAGWLLIRDKPPFEVYEFARLARDISRDFSILLDSRKLANLSGSRNLIHSEIISPSKHFFLFAQTPKARREGGESSVGNKSSGQSRKWNVLFKKKKEVTFYRQTGDADSYRKKRGINYVPKSESCYPWMESLSLSAGQSNRVLEIFR